MEPCHPAVKHIWATERCQHIVHPHSPFPHLLPTYDSPCSWQQRRHRRRAASAPPPRARPTQPSAAACDRSARHARPRPRARRQRPRPASLAAPCAPAPYPPGTHLVLGSSVGAGVEQHPRHRLVPARRSRVQRRAIVLPDMRARAPAHAVSAPVRPRSPPHAPPRPTRLGLTKW